MAGIGGQVWARAAWQRPAAWLLGLVLCLGLGAARAAEKSILRAPAISPAAAGLDDDGNARVIVKYRQGSALAQSRRGAQRLGRQLQLNLVDGHVLGVRSQSLRGRGIGAQALAARLASDPDVEWVQPVRRKTVRALLPNDPLFADNQVGTTPVAGQWYLRAPDATRVSAVNAVGAWAITEGSASITVAVLDTGVRYDHPDLAGKLWPGYDFVSRSTTANDGGGRDADANDPGDWSTSADSCGAADSSWHGTQVAGLIGAATDNGIGIAGTGRNTMVLPVRVLGRCGGFDDDIIAGMRWAGGLSNAAGCTSSSAATASCNPHPARVLNLSLGSSGTCSNAYRDAIGELNAAGVVVVVASGNDAGHAVNEPANCTGALAVAGVRHAGTKVGYSNLGPQIAIAAPAGNCVTLTGSCVYPLVTTLNSGTTTPGASIYSTGTDPSLGTSFATPIVAGSIALMLAVNPELTPAQAKATLQVAARPFPSTGAQEPGTVACRAPDATDQIECYCTTTTCGAGLLDAEAAVARAKAIVPLPVAVIGATPSTLTVGTTTPLDGTASSVSGGRQIVGHLWTLTSGAGMARLTGATDAARAFVVFDAPGTATVQLTVTDGGGLAGSVSRTLTAVAAPVARLTASTSSPTVGAPVSLSAAASTVGDGRSVASYLWAVQAGTGRAALTGAANGPGAELLGSAAGTVVVSLTIVDSAGVSSTTTQSFNLVAPPSGAISPVAGSPTVGTSFSLAAADVLAGSGRTISSYAWQITQGTAFARIDGQADQASVNLAALASGTATLTLTLTDTAGASTTLSSLLTVAAAPSAKLSTPTSAPLLGTPITLDGRLSTAASGRSLVGYRWVLVSGAEFVSLSGALDQATVTANADALGTAVVQLTVTDSAGATAQAETSFTVTATAPPTVAIVLTPADQATVGGTLSLGGAASSVAPGRTVAAYQWRIVAGAERASWVGDTDKATASLALGAVGDVVLSLAVTDDAGATSVATQTVTIAAAPVVVTPPTAGASSGGGAMGVGWVLGLLLAALLLWRQPPRRPAVVSVRR